MAAVAAELGARSIATLRFQFPYMERGSRRPDPPAVAEVEKVERGVCHDTDAIGG